MLSKLKFAPFILLIAFVALYRPASPTAAPLPAPVRARPASWVPAIAPTVSFSAPSAEADTSGAFSITLAFSDAGGDAIAPSSFQLMASRAVTVASTAYAAGVNLAEVSGFMASLDASGGSVSVDQTSSGILFDNGEYVLSARVKNTGGRWANWVTLRFYIEGASASVVKAASTLKHGDVNATITLSGSGLSTITEADFGADITVSGLSANSTSVTATVTVAEDAAAGPRVVTLGGTVTTFVASPQASGIVNIIFPTERLPQGGAGEARRNAATAGQGIVLKNGAFTWSECDLSIAGVCLDLEWRRTHRSDIDFDGPMGRNWHAYYFQRVIYDGGLKWYTGEGRLEAFSAVSGGFVAPAGLYVKAERDAATGVVTLTDRHGEKLIFNEQGKLAFIVERNSNRIECEYNFLGQLFRIIDSRGERVRLIYGADGRVDTLRDRAWSDTTPRTVKYDYNEQGELTRHKAPETAQYFDTKRLTREYQYDGSHRMTRIVNPREFTGSGVAYLENDYASGKVVAQRIGGSGNWSTIRYPANKLRRVIDPRGLRTDYDLNNVGASLTVTRFTGFWSVDTGSPINHASITQTAAKLRSTDPDSFIDDYAYNMATEVTRHTLPRGNKVKFAYPDPEQTASGTSTAIGTTTLTDSAASWTTNQHAGRWLQVGTDVSEFRVYVIVSNTATTLTLDTFEDLTADGFAPGAAFAIFTANPDPLAAGNCLTVTRQDGPVGSQADIVTSTSYEPRFQFPQTLTDARGHVTTLTWGYEVSGVNDANECNLVALALPPVSLGQPSTQSIAWAYAYDSRGRLTSTTDPEGVTTGYEYFSGGDADAYLQTIVRDVGGLNITYEYERDSVGQVTGIWPPRAHESGADKNSHKLSFEINELGQTFHAVGPVLFETGTARTDEYFVLDENGNLISALKEYVTAGGVEPDAPTNIFDPASYPRATLPMAATWVETTHAFNTCNEITSRTIDVDSGTTVARATWTLAYDASFNAATLTSPEGRVSVRAFDERNLPFTLTLAPSTAIAAQWRTDYDANGNATRTQDARGNDWVSEFDGFERKTREIDPLGHYVRFGFDAQSNETQREWFSAANTLLARSERDFDEANRIYRERQLAKDHTGASIGDGEDTNMFLLDALGRRLESSDEFGRVTHFAYDNASRVTQIIDAALNEIEFGYDAAGGILSRTQHDYDAANDIYVSSSAHADLDRQSNVLRLRDRRNRPGLNTEAAFAYDGNSQLVSARHGGHTLATDYRYDLRGLPTGATFKPSSIEASWIVTARGYDADGLLANNSVIEDSTATTPVAQLTQFTRDARGRSIQTTLPSSATWSFTFDACDNVASQTDPTDTLAQFTNDARGLCTLATITRGAGVLGSTQESWGYDGMGRMILATTTEGSQTLSSESFTYNTFSQCETSAQSLWRQDGQALGTFTSSREFDATGFCNASVFAGGRRIEYSADGLNRIAEISEESNPLAKYEYVGKRIKNIAWSNGTQSAFEYDADLLQASSLTRGSETLFGCEARYDAAGSLMAQRFAHEGNNGDVFRYDDLPAPIEKLQATLPKQTWHPFDDFKAPKPVQTWHPFDGSFTSTPKQTWHPFDDFKAPKPVQTWHPFDGSFTTTPKQTWHPFDEFKSPRPVQTWHPFDASIMPVGPRLVNSYYGVNLADDADFDDVPTAFALARDYVLDTRSSRVSTLNRDEASNTVYETPYASGADNRYTEVNGQALSYDSAGRITFDVATGLHYAYDWLGRVVAQDIESDFAEPEKLISYDGRGRRVLEQWFYSYGGSVRYATHALLYDDREFACTELALDNSAATLGSTQYIAGPSPANWREVEPTFDLAVDSYSLRDSIVHELASLSSQVEQRFRCENVQGRLMGVCNEDGTRLAEIGYTDFGAPLIRRVLFERGDLTSVASADTPVAGQTTITLSASVLTASLLKGCEICCALPGSLDHYRTATVLDNSASSLIVDDPSGRIYDALQYVNFVVFDFLDASVGGNASTGGTWSGDGMPGGGITAFTHTGQIFGNVAGWLVSLNAERGGALQVFSVDGATLAFQGDATGLAHEGDRYRVYAPFGVSAQTTGMELDLVKRGSGIFAGTTRYEGPLAGYFGGSSVSGAQPGHARQGGPLIGPRQFDVSWGRYREPSGAWPNRYER